jgi:hypothetical protein
MNKTLLRKIKSTFSGTGRPETSEKPGKFLFKRTVIKKTAEPRERSSNGGNSWNSKTFFLAVSIFAVMLYSVAQLAIGVYLDDQSKQLQALREEETYLIEENKNIDSKVAKHKSKIRVEIAAAEELEMKKSSEKDVVRIIGATISSLVEASSPY